MAAIKLPKVITVPPTGKHTATFFFFHGSGEKIFIINYLNK